MINPYPRCLHSSQFQACIDLCRANLEHLFKSQEWNSTKKREKSEEEPDCALVLKLLEGLVYDFMAQSSATTNSHQHIVFTDDSDPPMKRAKIGGTAKSPLFTNWALEHLAETSRLDEWHDCTIEVGWWWGSMGTPG